MKWFFPTSTSVGINCWINSSLLHFIKRNKHPFDRKIDKQSPEFKDYLAIKSDMEELRRRNEQLEEHLNSLIVQNSKILEDNKYLCLEMLKTRWDNKKRFRSQNWKISALHSFIYE